MVFRSRKPHVFPWHWVGLVGLRLSNNFLDKSWFCYRFYFACKISKTVIRFPRSQRPSDCNKLQQRAHFVSSTGHPSKGTPDNMEGDCSKALFITANVGSIFEEPDTMFPIWMKSFFQTLQNHKPGLVALHCQEVGGKNYEASMQHVNHFVKTLLACEELHKYDRARIFLDEDYTASDKFTALGNIYFVHEEVSDVLIWDFVDCKFIEVEGREVLSGNIENVPIKEKAKFPQHFFPEFKWSRKGFLRTRWSINNCIFDLVNIHLFHDASNIVAMESSPSIYSGNRQRALLHTLQRFENDKYSKVPLFLFGDFNFRLDSNLLLQELTNKLVACQTKGKKDQVNKIDYTEEGNGKIVLTIGSKSFDYYDRHSDLFVNMNKWLHQYDRELSAFRDRLFEFEICFPPSYPFCEDVANGISYMKTRVPSWCDRILLTHATKDILIQEPCHPLIYDLIGKDVCMGDHKPVYLFVHLKPGKGKSEHQRPLSLESPTPSNVPVFELKRARTLSINGELVENVDFNSPTVDLSPVNIHDYAVFEKENDLIQEFRESIKVRKAKETIEPGVGVTRKPSFHDVAKKVQAMEKVLLQWPRIRHHSSSSEDFSSGESEVISIHEDQTNGPTELSNAHKIPVNVTGSCSSETADGNDPTKVSFITNNNNSEPAAYLLNNNKEGGDKSAGPENVVASKQVEIDLTESKSKYVQGSQVIALKDGLTEGCGDDREAAGDVGVLSQHDGCLHVDLPAPTPSTSSTSGRPASTSAEKEAKAGKAEDAGPARPPSSSLVSGCCRCVVL